MKLRKIIEVIVVLVLIPTLTLTLILIAFEILLRPDVTEENILILLEQVLLSIGGSFRILYDDNDTNTNTNNAPTLEIATPVDQAKIIGWSNIKVTIGSTSTNTTTNTTTNTDNDTNIN